MKRILILLFIISIGTGSSILAQDSGNFRTVPRKSSKSILVGGFATEESLLLLTKAGYEYKHWGILVDLSSDHTWEDWEKDKSRSAYHLWAVGLNGRYYIKPLGRSLFAEAGVGIAFASLITTDQQDKSTTRNGTLPLAGWGLGWRFGKKPTGLFGEIGFRTSYALKELHVYTDPIAPAASKSEPISYHSWYFEKGQPSSQLYVSVGYSF